MLFMFDKIVFLMAFCRFLSSTIEFSAALLMLRFNSVETAFKINAALALVGPTVMLTVTSLGLVGLAGKISFSGMVFVLLGIGFIFYGVNRI
ncbi:hypothetical protein DCCM_2080 [Desulfocucumis palustris]|uniref:DUF2619 domain-containing protein n=1 Tax=Desulfocucumis palustris TaxID=1898651 RepID=A0A2L2XBC6_9FIRM|nr:YqhV family protein [Desulfocucumis palustris]GBF32983.1 hypothetical protein DCCM_2080 [Desulfocucumis palustris]